MCAVVVRNLTVFATQPQHACGTQANGGKNNCCQNCPTKRFVLGQRRRSRRATLPWRWLNNFWTVISQLICCLFEFKFNDFTFCPIN
jgi:hypothetical protein